MLVDSMVPEAQSKAKESTGLATVLGFALAAGAGFGVRVRAAADSAAAS